MFFYTLKNILQYNFFHNSLYFIQLKHSDKSTEFTRLLKESMAQKKVKNLCKLCNFTSQFLWMHYIHRKFKTGQKIQLTLGEESSSDGEDREGFWSSSNISFLDPEDSYTSVLVLWKFMELYTYDSVRFSICMMYLEKTV